MNNIIATRAKIGEKILSLLSALPEDRYVYLDFILDSALRKMLDLPEKNLGKAPYEDWVDYDIYKTKD